MEPAASASEKKRAQSGRSIGCGIKDAPDARASGAAPRDNKSERLVFIGCIVARFASAPTKLQQRVSALTRRAQRMPRILLINSMVITSSPLPQKWAG
jgi:hypothetical protein